MAYIRIYACPSSRHIQAGDELPSPVSCSPTSEQIWSEDTGRAQEGSNLARMIGKSITSKQTYAIKWGVLTESEFNSITSKLTRGFFKFGLSTNGSLPSGGSFYRSEISYELLQAGDEVFYKDAQVSVIEQ